MTAPPPTGSVPTADFRSTAILVLATSLSSLFRVAYVVYAGRVLGPAEYADLYAALAVALVFATGLAPVGDSITRFLSLYRGRGEEGKVLAIRRIMPRRVAHLAVLLALVGLVIVWPLYRLLRFDSPWVALLVVAVLPLNLVTNTPRGILRGVHRFAAYGLNLLLDSALRLALCVSLLSVVDRASVAFSAHLAGLLVALWLGHRQISTVGEGAQEESFDQRQLERFVRPLFVLAFLSALSWNLDVLFAKALFQPLEVGRYSAVSALAKLVGLVLVPFQILIFPTVATAFARGERLLRPTLRTVAGFLAVAAVILVAFQLAGDRALLLLFGDEYVGAGDLLVPLTLVAVLSAVSMLLGQVSAARGRFGFLGAYAGGITLQVVAMLLASDSMRAFVSTVLTAQGLTLVALVVSIWRTR